MSRDELRKTFFEELAPFISKTTSEEGYQTSDMWNFAIGSRELKFKVRFSRSIFYCNIVLHCSIITVRFHY